MAHDLVELECRKVDLQKESSPYAPRSLDICKDSKTLFLEPPKTMWVYRPDDGIANCHLA